MAALHATKDAATGGSHGLGFATLPIPMAVLDGELRILEANAAFAELLQVPAASLIGEPLGPRIRSAATDAPPGEGVQTFEFQFSDGPPRLRLDLQQEGEHILAGRAAASAGRRRTGTRRSGRLRRAGRLWPPSECAGRAARRSGWRPEPAAARRRRRWLQGYAVRRRAQPWGSAGSRNPGRATPRSRRPSWRAALP